MKTFWFDGESAAAHGLIISGSGTFDAAERDVEMVSVPGRSGDLIVDNGRYKNIPISYPASIYTDFAANAEKTRAWLGSKTGYCRLEDDYDPDHFRLARFKGPLNFTPGFLNRTAECTINFDCKPQRFLKSGEAPFLTGRGRTIINPTRFPAKPLLAVTCTAAVAEINFWNSGNQIAKFTVNTAARSSSMTLYLDSETGEIYELSSTGSKISRPEMGTIPYQAPSLFQGETSVVLSVESGTVETIYITPRWWTL